MGSRARLNTGAVVTFAVAALFALLVSAVLISVGITMAVLGGWTMVVASAAVLVATVTGLSYVRARSRPRR